MLYVGVSVSFTLNESLGAEYALRPPSGDVNTISDNATASKISFLN